MFKFIRFIGLLCLLASTSVQAEIIRVVYNNSNSLLRGAFDWDIATQTMVTGSNSVTWNFTDKNSISRVVSSNIITGSYDLAAGTNNFNSSLIQTLGGVNYRFQIFPQVTNGNRTSVGRVSEPTSNPSSITRPFGVQSFNQTYSVSVLQVASVPEPETYGMMLLGLGLLGFVASRKQA